ncbi:ADP-ribose glycohydrolase OARD1-like [Dendronephthya gigantea]|uniref:ADP-ribose glycohydrolase OARD1-like n=1 Tax=Dendronephthya gigantea TaxID=151771 RepID=UPI00106C9856|nr:ADP-ribose glycohydrolase OARD1-like [Dendronephthya gigantea]
MAHAKESGFHYQEIKGDLFSCSKDASLAHCISADVHMGKGIATIFKKMFGGVEELRSQGKKPGEVSILRREGRFIYYLVTKPRYFHKPTYDTLRSSLIAMKVHCKEHEVTTLAMPRIGCGLDRLDWGEVRKIIKETFQDTNIHLTIYAL